MPNEEQVVDGSADVGAQTDPAEATAATAAAPTADVKFTSEQQAHIDKLIGERLTREREKVEADLKAKGEADAKAAEAQKLKDEQKWEELAKTQEAKAAEAESKLAAATAQLEKANKVLEGLVEARKKELPEAMLKALDGRDIYDQLELAEAFINALPAQPASGRTAATTPTPKPQKGQQDYVQQAIERQNKRAVKDDPYAELMKR